MGRRKILGSPAWARRQSRTPPQNALQKKIRAYNKMLRKFGNRKK